jgi:two-component system nitrogen regulation response regulator NtrX
MAHDILIVDDEPDIRLLIEGLLSDEGYETRTASTAEEAIAAFRQRRPSLVILDVWLQDSAMDGLGILEILHREEPQVPAIMISGHGTIEMAVAAIQQGAYDFIEKPFKVDRLLLVVRRALEAALLARENAELRLRAGPENELIGRSPAIEALRAAIERVAPTGSRVLISGAAGVGKEIAARMIHRLSRRAEGPFVVLNGATLNPGRFEEELFGIEAGPDPSVRPRRAEGPFVVLNGATLNPGRFEEELFGIEAGPDPSVRPRRAGVLERAHGGTLLLDEVSDMPLETQGKIVRALQDQTFERLGGAARVRVDVRVVATTNRDLQAEIAAGRFREDLYYRLSVVPLRVPALRERREDIPALAQHFLQRSAESAGMPRRELSTDALTALQAYDWPGNVRQLRNLMDWLMIMAVAPAGDPIRADSLPPEIISGVPAVLALDPHADIMALPLREARELFESQYLQAQLLRFSGHVSRTAQFVGLDRSALHRKLKQLGVHTEERG